MTRPLSREQVREFDRRAIEELGIPGIVLMENAGRGAAERLMSLGIRGPVVIACGKGNNGGDGLVIARHLVLHGHVVRIHFFARIEDVQGDAKTNLDIATRLRLPLVFHDGQPANVREEFASSDWIMDALFGTGLTGPPRFPHDRVIELINDSGAKVLAVDIPSGLDCDTGQPLGPTVRATHTVTFVAPKVGFLSAAARQWTGAVHVVPIGLP